ncbi:MAG: IclR family transcriptional regulator [Betaproteobacteria bacterium]|nr:IclR family transcriptional regulator [Betaproteobacteria bacterium]
MERNAKTAPVAKAPATPRTPTRLSSVANSIRLLKAFSDEEHELGVTNLAKRLGLAKSTVHRLASTLIREDMLEQDSETGRYRLGLALFELGARVRRKMNVFNEAQFALKDLVEKTGETAHLTVLDHTSVLYLYKVESRQAIRMKSVLGARAPAHCSADGKALLAFQTAEVVDSVLHLGLPALTPKTLTNEAALIADLAQVRARGYAIDDEETETGLRSLAAPVRDHRGEVVAAISIAGPVQRINKKVLLSYAPAVVSAANLVSLRLGHLPQRHGRLRAA